MTATIDEMEKVLDLVKFYITGRCDLTALIMSLQSLDNETLYESFDITDVLGRAQEIVPSISSNDCRLFFFRHYKKLGDYVHEAGHEFIDENLRNDFIDYSDPSDEDEEEDEEA